LSDDVEGSVEEDLTEVVAVTASRVPAVGNQTFAEL